MVRAATRQADLSVHNAWHTAIFALVGYSGKLKDKKLSDYLSSRVEVGDEERQRHENANIIHFFQSLKARGADIEITRTVN